MSDEEYSDEEEVQPKSRKRGKSEASESGHGMSDIEEKLRKKKEEEEAMWGEYIEQRKRQRQKEEEELKKLKERQAKRKTQRAEQEKMLIEMKKKQEEQRVREIEEKKQREIEAKRKRLEEAEKKRVAMMEAMEKQKAAASKPNFKIEKKDVAAGPPSALMDKFNNVALARSELNKPKEQLAEEKEIALSFRVKPLEIEGLSTDKLRAKAQQLWEMIVQLESDKYDLEERQKRQDYDLKELNERQRQINRNKALKKGLDPEAFTGKYPPKINVANKFERRVDRREYKDKKDLFDGGWEKLSKEEQEKIREEREKEYKEGHGDSKAPKWDPCNPRNKETFEPTEKTFDDTDDFDIMDTYKPFSSGIEESTPAPPAPAPTRQPEPEPEAEEEEEYEEEEEEEEE